MKFCIFTPTPQREKLGGFLVANFLSYFPKENGLKFVTPRTSENFTTFSTARKEIYHLELTLGRLHVRNLIEGTCDAALTPPHHRASATQNGILGPKNISVAMPAEVCCEAFRQILAKFHFFRELRSFSRKLRSAEGQR